MQSSSGSDSAVIPLAFCALLCEAWLGARVAQESSRPAAHVRSTRARRARVHGVVLGVVGRRGRLGSRSSEAQNPALDALRRHARSRDASRPRRGRSRSRAFGLLALLSLLASRPRRCDGPRKSHGDARDASSQRHPPRRSRRSRATRRARRSPCSASSSASRRSSSSLRSASGASSFVGGKIDSFGANTLYIFPQPAQASGATSKSTGRITEDDGKAIAREAVSVAGVAPLLDRAARSSTATRTCRRRSSA